jgi:hypothetical protein
MYWSRSLVESLQAIFVGSGTGQINGDAIQDGTLAPDKLLASAAGLYNTASVQYTSATPVTIQVPNKWVASGGVTQGPNILVSLNYSAWVIVTFSGNFTEANANGCVVTLQENDGSGWYGRASWKGGLPVDANISMLLAVPANAQFQCVISVAQTQTLVNPIFTLGLLGRTAVPV